MSRVDMPPVMIRRLLCMMYSVSQLPAWHKMLCQVKEHKQTCWEPIFDFGCGHGYKPWGGLINHFVNSQEDFAWGISWLEFLQSIFLFQLFSLEAEALPQRKKHDFIFPVFLSTLWKFSKNISGKDIVLFFETSGCSSLRGLGYHRNVQGLKHAPFYKETRHLY